MDSLKTQQGASEILTFVIANLKTHDPAEKIAALRAAAFTVEATLQAESLKVMYAELVRKFTGS